MRALAPFLFLPALLVGCGDKAAVDADGDGLNADQETTFGTDDTTADTDGDGLSDKDEFDLGTDGTVTDSDADGYLDGDEVTEGSDPTDPSSLIYTGGWPYNADKDSMVDPGMDDKAGKGNMLADIQLIDQFGEVVDIYDFANSGKPLIIDVSTVWCGWCREMAAWLGGDMEEAATETAEGYNWEESFKSADWYDVIPEMVQNGDVYWVTILTEDSSGGTPKEKDASRWANDFPNDQIPILVDTEGNIETYMKVKGFPCVDLVDPNFLFEVTNGDYNEVFTDVLDEYQP